MFIPSILVICDEPARRAVKVAFLETFIWIWIRSDHFNIASVTLLFLHISSTHILIVFIVPCWDIVSSHFAPTHSTQQHEIDSAKLSVSQWIQKKITLHTLTESKLTCYVLARAIYDIPYGYAYKIAHNELNLTPDYIK